jgi:flagellar hook-associated protein FlgK
MADAGKTEVEAGMAADGTTHAQNVEAMGAQARGNRDTEVSKALLKGEAAPQQIEAAVGFNKLTEDGDKIKATPQPSFTPPQNAVPLAPIQVPEQQDPSQALAFPQ